MYLNFTRKGRGGTQRFKCKKCGKVFNSKEELQVHMATGYVPWKET
jgi:transposase-like protein